jgi:hypothetical protein
LDPTAGDAAAVERLTAALEVAELSYQSMRRSANEAAFASSNIGRRNVFEVREVIIRRCAHFESRFRGVHLSWCPS